MFSGRSLSGIACCGPARANPQTRASGGRVAEHRLDFHVLVETEFAPLATIAAALHAAERRLEVKAAIDRDPAGAHALGDGVALRSEEHTSELQSLMRLSYAVFCLKKKKTNLY